MGELTHFDANGASRMVDVAAKAATARQAEASGLVRMDPATLRLIQDARLSKGNVFEVARLAGIMAAKRTGELIPLCHPLGLDAVEVDFAVVGDSAVKISARAAVLGKTGVEMEALTAVAVAALTIYDMVKAIDRSVSLDQIQLDSKSGGQSGDYRRPGQP